MAPSAINTLEEYPTIFKYPLKGVVRVNGSEYQPDHESINSEQLVGRALKKRAEVIDHNTCEPGEEDTFFVADLGEVYRQHTRWTRHLARVKPHYAVKCNPDPQVLRLLEQLGTGFDCASKAEIEQILNLGVNPKRIIYAQPCKTKSYVRYAEKQGVKQMTFDNADELYKIKQLFPDAELFLRILTDDSASLCRLSLKFGASLDTTQALLELARELELNVVGVAFHVGSGASDPNAFLKAVTDARFVFDQAAVIGFDLHTLDVGGGFVPETFEDMAEVLSGALDVHFPPHVRIIGEPGRFYVQSAFTIACNVIARRTVEDPELKTKSYMLYLNDGLYGNFSGILFDHQKPIPQILICGNDSQPVHEDRSTTYSENGSLGIEYSIWGPTCDGIDCISASSQFSCEIDTGDWLYFQDMGAYTKCSATRFNGFTNKHDVIYVSSEPEVRALLNM